MMYHVALGSCMYISISIQSKPLYGNRLRCAYRMTTLLIVVVLICRDDEPLLQGYPVTGEGKALARKALVDPRRPAGVVRTRASGTRAFPSLSDHRDDRFEDQGYSIAKDEKKKKKDYSTIHTRILTARQLVIFFDDVGEDVTLA